jgi:hypothetical protein
MLRENLGEAGTFAQHDQHPLLGTYAELSRRGGDSGRSISRFAIAHRIVTKGDNWFFVPHVGLPVCRFCLLFHRGRRRPTCLSNVCQLGGAGRHFTAAYARAVHRIGSCISIIRQLSVPDQIYAGARLRQLNTNPMFRISAHNVVSFSRSMVAHGPPAVERPTWASRGDSGTATREAADSNKTSSNTLL